MNFRFWFAQLSARCSSLLPRHWVHWPRPAKQLFMVGTDLFTLHLATWLAYSIRLGHGFWPDARQWLLIVAAPLLAIPVFYAHGLYRSVIRYVGEKALWSIVKSTTLAALLWSAFVFFMDVQRFEGAPRTVAVLYWILATLLVLGTRLGARWLLLKRQGMRPRKHVLVYGANEAGVQLVQSLWQGQELWPVAFVDDQNSLQHKDVAGLRVYPPSELPWLRSHFELHEAIVCLPHSSQAQRRQAVNQLEAAQLKTRILPALTDIASGKNLVSLVREVDVGDLLGRDPVAANPSLMGQCIAQRVVLVTGAGGSIGSELASQIANLRPQHLLLLDHSEPALYQVHRRIEAMGLCPCTALLGSVTNPALLSRLFAQHRIHTVYHAAAHKHVPLVQSNALEGIRNNVLGTLSLAQCAATHAVETFVLISTDKAVRPTNIMGASKRWAELALHHAASQAQAQGGSAAPIGTTPIGTTPTGTAPTRFCAVRFGNVLGSSGSVIPLFREQIAKGGPITVTHPEVTRFFMSIHEAVELVIQAGSLAQGNDVFLLNMGEPVKIVDLAHNMLRLAGLAPLNPSTGTGDIAVVFTGLRPGEKLFEELLINTDNAQATPHPKIMRAHEPHLNPDQLATLFAALLAHLEQGQEQAACKLLMDVALA